MKKKKKEESIDMETWQNTRYIYLPSGTQAGEIEGAISSEISSGEAGEIQIMYSHNLRHCRPERR